MSDNADKRKMACPFHGCAAKIAIYKINDHIQKKQQEEEEWQDEDEKVEMYKKANGRMKVRYEYFSSFFKRKLS